MKRALFIAFATAALLACKGKDSATAPAPTPDVIAGLYDLKTINGSALPYTVLDQGASGKLQVRVASLTINASGIATSSTTTRVLLNLVTLSEQTDSKQLTFAWNGTKWTTTNASGTTTGSVSGTSVTIVDNTPGNPQLTFVYSR
jgi:hypothetical protein